MEILFSSKDYPSFLLEWLNRQDRQHGLKSEMAKAMDCQNAHLTRVLRGEAHLTMDQAFRLSQHLGLSKAESQFFLKLVEHDRAGDPQYRLHLKKDMEQIKRDQENLSKRFQQSSLGDFEKEMTYYSSWHWIALHFITEIPRFQGVREIADKLGLSEDYVHRSLQVLEKFKLVKRNSKRWTLNTGSIHLPKTSPLNSVQHGNWRSRAVLKSQDPDGDGLHFTVVQTISHADFERIKQMLLEAIDRYRAIAKPSEPEDLICFNCDFFRA